MKLVNDWADFDEVIKWKGSGAKGLPQSEWLGEGQYPVIGQGASFVEGWSNRQDLVVDAENGLVLYGGHTRRSKHVTGHFVPGPNVKMLVPSHTLDSKYLHYYLSQAKIPNKGYADHFSEVRRLRIPLPPLEEQRRIAAVLDKAAKVRRLLAKKELSIASLMQSAFVDLFGYPQEASAGSQSPVVTLGECCTLFSGGTLPAGEANTGQEGGFLLLKVSDMNLPGNERSLRTSNLWSPKPGANSATCPAGSVVIPKRGGAIGTNKKRVVDRDAVLDPNLMALTPIEGMMITEYLLGWFSFLNLSSITSGSSVPQLNKQDLSPLRVVLPPMKAQAKYKEIALRVSLISESLRRESISLQTLIQSLESAAFGAAKPE